MEHRFPQIRFPDSNLFPNLSSSDHPLENSTRERGIGRSFGSRLCATRKQVRYRLLRVPSPTRRVTSRGSLLTKSTISKLTLRDMWELRGFLIKRQAEISA